MSFPNNIFKPVITLKGDGIELSLKNTFLYSDFDIPGYEFDVKVDGEHAGTFTALIESEFDKIAEEGNVGLIINQKFFGKKLPSKVAIASYPLFESHGQSDILITFDEQNHAVEAACEELSAIYMDTLNIDGSGASKKRYSAKAKS